jgi:uncharacterized membrane protein YphA (DoxX/SURF4 family)
MRAPACWLAALRVVVGAWFLKGAVAKVTIVLAWGFLPVPGANARWIATMPTLLARYAADNPITAYRAFLLDTVIPNAATFANLTAVGETVVAISLVLGLLTPVGAAVGLCLSIIYGLAVQHMSSGQLGFHVLLVSLMLAFFFARAGRTFGLDARLRNRWPAAAVSRWLT